MVTLAQSSPGDRSARAPQSKTATVMLERDDFSSNRHPALSFCLSMISAQTPRVCREGKPVSTLGSSPRACFSGSCSSDRGPAAAYLSLKKIVAIQTEREHRDSGSPQAPDAGLCSEAANRRFAKKLTKARESD